MPTRGGRDTAPFITFEGGEGAGKSTQAHLLAAALAASGRPVLLTREPGGSPGAATLRTLLLYGRDSWAPLAETLLHFAARADHVARTIQPALRAQMLVICDRFTDSTLAYQALAGGGDPDQVAALSDMIGLRPDLTIVLAASPAIAAARLSRRGTVVDRYERRGPDFHHRVDAAFRRIAADDPGRCVLLDADNSVAQVHAAVMTVVSAWLDRQA